MGPPLATPTGCHPTVQSLDSRASQTVTGRQSEDTRRSPGEGACLRLSRPIPGPLPGPTRLWTRQGRRRDRRQKPDLWVLSQEPRGPPLTTSDSRGDWV